MCDYFFEVWDDKGTYGYFLSEENAERCAAHYEKENYSDEPDKCHVYVWRRSFDDFYYAPCSEDK